MQANRKRRGASTYRVPTRSVGTSVPIVLFVLAASATAQNDRVRTTKGTEAGEVADMSAVAVTVKRGSQTKTLPVNEIESVQFAGEPSELTQARVNARNGGYEAAAAKLGEIDVSKISNLYIKQDIAFYRAYCQAKLALLGGADLTDAGRDLNSFAQGNRQSFHYLQAVELLGDLLAASGRYDRAVPVYGQLAKAPFPSSKVRAGVLIGRALQNQGKHDEALERFETALAIEDDSPEVETQRLAALLGKAISLAATGEVEQGVSLVEQVIREADPAEQGLLAVAYNALGSCYVQAGQKKDALFAFLHVDLLFATQPEAHAESLYHLATLWDEFGKPNDARDARRTLQERYASSQWAKKAGEGG